MKQQRPSNPALFGGVQFEKYLIKKFGQIKPASKGQYRVPCPTCDPNDRKKMKRYVFPDSLHTKCYICGKPFKLTDDVKNFSCDTVEIQIKEHPMARQFPFKKIINLMTLSKDHPAINFLKKDHLLNLEDYTYNKQIGFIDDSDGLHIEFNSGTRLYTGGSLFFPVFEKDVFVGWQLRFVPGTKNWEKMKNIRYIHLFSKGKYIYNFDQAIKFNHVVVVEGIKKALKGNNAVATFGKNISDEQKNKIVNNWKTIVLMLDGDEATQKMATQLVDEFVQKTRKCININPSQFGYPSPDEMTVEVFDQLVTEHLKKLNK